MDKKYPLEAWRRLGKVLEARRAQLGYGFRQRERFLAERGGPPPSVKTLARLERGERTSYPPGTVTRLESLYGYAPGSFEAVLAGGDAVPDPPVPPRLHPIPVPPLAAAASEAHEILADLLSRYPDDEVIQTIGAQVHKPAYAMVQEILRRLEREGDQAPAIEVRARLVAAYPDDEVLQVINRQRAKKASMVVAEILDWLDSQGPVVPQARNGTAG